MRSRFVLLLSLAVIAAAGSVGAHHSFTATYDAERTIRLEGVIKELLWRNPHSFLRIDVTDKDGSTKTWSLEWGSISQLAKADVTRTTLRPGDRVKVAGEPARDATSARMLLQSLERPIDGFVWRGKVD